MEETQLLDLVTDYVGSPEREASATQAALNRVLALLHGRNFYLPCCRQLLCSMAT